MMAAAAAETLLLQHFKTYKIEKGVGFVRKILSTLLACGFSFVLLSGCGGRSGQDAAPSSTDFNQYLQSQSFYGCTDQGWYIEPYEQVYYFAGDLKSAPIPLCAKADCNHSDPTTCSSYPTEGSYGIYAWNDMLYYLCMPMDHDGLDLYQMGLDGQDRKVLVNLFPGANNYSYVANVGGGYLTVAMSEYTVNGDVATLYLISLVDPTAAPAVLFSNAEQVETAQGDTSQIPRPYVMHVGEKWVFYSVEMGPSGAVTTSLYGYEIATGETKLLVEDEFFVGGDLSPVEDTLYWYDTDGYTFGRLNQIDLNTGETNMVAEIPITEDVWGSMDDKYLYISGGSEEEPAELAIYDFEGNAVQTISCEELGMPIVYAFSNDGRVVFRHYDLGSIMPACWLDKEQLERGKVKIHTIPETG